MAKILFYTQMRGKETGGVAGEQWPVIGAQDGNDAATDS
jgi:hypothetical protein